MTSAHLIKILFAGYVYDQLGVCCFSNDQVKLKQLVEMMSDICHSVHTYKQPW